MRYRRWLIAGGIVLSLLSFSTANAATYYLGKVTGIQGTVFGTAAGGHAVTSLSQGFTVRIYKKQGSRYLVQFLRNMESVEGWMEVDQVTILPNTKTEIQSTSAPPAGTATKPQEQKKNSSPQVDATAGGRFFVAPVYNVHKFGTTQFRIGGAYDIYLSQKVILGIPLSYSMGGGFYGLAGGLELFFEVANWEAASMNIRTGALFERFAGNGKSFMAGTVDVGAGFRFPLSEDLFIDFEPASFELTPFATEGLPLFARGQVILGLGGKW